METTKCGCCCFFVRHYSPGREGEFLPTEHGHCIYERTGLREAGKRGCVHFLPSIFPEM